VLPNLVSATAAEPTELGKALAALIQTNDQPLDAEIQKTIKCYITGLEGTLASDNILAALDRVVVSKRSFALSLVHRAVGLAIRASRPFRHTLNPTVQSKTYSHQKFNSLSAAEIKIILQRLSTVSGRFTKVDVKPVRGTATCYRITEMS
jgi:hypothetical protein